ncbi:MAG: SDR family oxidoreductase [Gemmatimonadaceae bacterium]|nr:SDR family oxidoreductase [Gemmatimonadaceae bacterium]
MKLENQLAIVTGAGVRVGRAIALALADAGMNVAVHYAHSKEEADATVAEIRKRGRTSESFEAALDEPGEPEKLMDAIVAKMGVPHVVVNSAAIMQRTPFGEVTYESWEATMNLNLRAPFFLSQAAAKVMSTSGGVIINIADLAAFETWSGFIPHSISKAGVVQMTRALAHALGPKIRVNAVAPGVVMLPEDWPQDSAQRLIDTTPLKRLGTPNDVTQALLYLVRAEYVTGETIIVDGGRHVRK